MSIAVRLNVHYLYIVPASVHLIAFPFRYNVIKPYMFDHSISIIFDVCPYKVFIVTRLLIENILIFPD
jgi:hypothetical protein